MSPRARFGIALAIAILSAAGITVLVVRWFGGPSRASLPAGFESAAATAPFTGAREVHLSLAGRCVRVAVADTPALRARGLRGVTDPSPYAGLLFAQHADGDTPFTMAGVAQPLAIAWYDAHGREVGAARMHPCPHGSDASCPVYRSPRPYRLALELPAGSAPPPAQLAPCT